MRAWLALVGCAAFSLGVPPVAADPGPGATPDNPENTVTTSTVDQRIIVQWEPGVARGDRVQARSAAGATDFVDLGNKRFQLLTLAEDQSAADAIESLRADPNVVLATRDGYSELHATQPNDPLFGQLWGLHNTGAGIKGFVGAVPGADINALAAWDKTVGDGSVIVADLDTGTATPTRTCPVRCGPTRVTPQTVSTTTATGSSTTPAGSTSSAPTPMRSSSTAMPPTTSTPADTASTLPVRSRPRATTASGSPAWRRRRRSCRSASAAGRLGQQRGRRHQVQVLLTDRGHQLRRVRMERRSRTCPSVGRRRYRSAQCVGLEPQHAVRDLSGQRRSQQRGDRDLPVLVEPCDLRDLRGRRQRRLRGGDRPGGPHRVLLQLGQDPRGLWPLRGPRC